MVTEIWLLFKNLECRWWCDECVSVCSLPSTSLPLTFTDTSAADPFCFRQGPSGRRRSRACRKHVPFWKWFFLYHFEQSPPSPDPHMKIEMGPMSPRRARRRDPQPLPGSPRRPETRHPMEKLVIKSQTDADSRGRTGSLKECGLSA